MSYVDLHKILQVKLLNKITGVLLTNHIKHSNTQYDKKKQSFA